MGKYGKKNEVNLNPLAYNITILGEGGIGKTTLAKEVCEKLVGEEGYMHFDIGKEDGRLAIEGLVSEPIEDFAKLNAVCSDIIENKSTDYPDLKVIIWDTLDELIPILEAEAVREWNVGKPLDKKAETINGAWTGFGKGQEHACGYLLNFMWELKKVGISSIIIGHVRRTDMTDAITQETYSKLTADTTQKYFNWIKNKMHFVGLAYIDREILKEKTGRKDIKGNDVMVSKSVNETRVISFRDNSYSVDSKSRFADIIDKVPFDSDEFIKAMQDAILAEHAKGTKTLEQTKKEQEAAAKEAEKKAIEYSESKKKEKELEIDRDKFIKTIQDNFVTADTSIKKKAKDMLTENGFSKFTDPEAPVSLLKEISELFV